MFQIQLNISMATIVDWLKFEHLCIEIQKV